jgi:ribulose-phosphate 3-epimerase
LELDRREGRIIGQLRQQDIEVGLAVNPEIELKDLEQYLSQIQRLQIMSIHPGHQGQEFLPETLDKIKESSRLRLNNNLDFKIGVDGGVTPANIRSIMDAGADYVVMGSHLLEGDIHVNLESIWEALQF